MATTSESVQAAVDSLEENTQTLDSFIESGPTEDVTTPDGTTIPSLQKVIEGVFTPINPPYAIVEPADGWLREFDPATSTMGQMRAVFATLIHDLTT